MKHTEILNKAMETLKNRKDRSCWDKGVTMYAMDLCQDLMDNVDYIDLSNGHLIMKSMLNGADNWDAYSWGGCSLIYDGDIAKRLCNPTELKRTHNGERRPNAREEWLDTQARALKQASLRLGTIIKSL